VKELTTVGFVGLFRAEGIEMAGHLLRHPLTALRRELGTSADRYLDRLDEVHHGLGYGRMAKGREKVSRWENGVHRPEKRAQHAMARLHGIADEAVDRLGWPYFLLLAFADDRPILDGPWTSAGTMTAVATTSREDPMDRRGFLISSGATLTGVAQRWRDAATDLPLPAPGRRLTGAVVTRLEQRLDDLRRLDDVLGVDGLLPVAVAEHRLLGDLAAGAGYDESVGRRLFTSLAEACRVCGALNFDAGRHAQAQRFYITSLRASACAGDRGVGANTLGFMSTQVGTVGNPQDAVNLVRTAQEGIREQVTPLVRAMLHVRAGRALSRTGDGRASAREFEAARNAYAKGSRDDDPAWAYWVTEREIEMAAGSAALALKEPGHALTRFEAARSTQQDTAEHARDSALYLSRTARAHLESGDLDAACATATEAFTQNTSARSERACGELNDIRSQLAPHRNARAVHDFLALSA
jgi:tetratricopeptide (TPR) repeat protein